MVEVGQDVVQLVADGLAELDMWQVVLPALATFLKRSRAQEQETGGDLLVQHDRRDEEGPGGRGGGGAERERAHGFP